MIISHSRKFCYWKIARTGSNTAEFCIRVSGVLDRSCDVISGGAYFTNVSNLDQRVNPHILPQDALEQGLLTREQYDEYDHYTIVRNPLDRWVSAYGWKHRFSARPVIEPWDFFARSHKDDLLITPQSRYLKLGRVQAFPFSDYENSLRTIIAKIGGRVEDVPNLSRKARETVLRKVRNAVDSDPELRRGLLEFYADDLKLPF